MGNLKTTQEANNSVYTGRDKHHKRPFSRPSYLGLLSTLCFKTVFDTERMKTPVLLSSLIAVVLAAPAADCSNSTPEPAPAPGCLWIVNGVNHTISVAGSETINGIDVACGTTGNPVNLFSVRSHTESAVEIKGIVRQGNRLICDSRPTEPLSSASFSQSKKALATPTTALRESTLSVSTRSTEHQMSEPATRSPLF